MMLPIFAAIAILQSAAAQVPAPPPAVATPVPTPTPGPAGCDTSEYDSFDFWVGEWEVFPNGSDTKVADSRIERLYNGCAVRENWIPLSGATGGSLNAYDPASQRWHQTWIGSAPGAVNFEGGPADGAMVMTGYWRGVVGPGTMGLVRMTYTANVDGSVRQHGEVSTDHGKHWSDSFDLIYRPKAETEDTE